MKKILIALLISVTLFGCSTSKAITMEEAIKVAKADVDGEVVRSSETKTNGTVSYEIELLKDDEVHNFVISSEGKVTNYVRSEKQSTNDQTTQPAATATPTAETVATATPTATPSTTTTQTTDDKKLIGQDEARKIALNNIGGGTVTECDLDYDDGVTHYEVEIAYNFKEYNVKINAYTGEILTSGRDY